MSRQFYRGGSIPAGHILGRVSGGHGPAELISLNDTHYHLAAASGGGTSSGGGGGITTPVSVASGGTGLISGTSGGIPAYTGSTTITSSGVLTANQIVLGGGAGAVPATLGSLGTTTTVLHGNAGGAPTFGAVSLTADVTGTLPVANGGTGLTAGTSGGVPAYTASGTIASSAALTATAVVVGGGAGAVPYTQDNWNFDANDLLVGTFNAATDPFVLNQDGLVVVGDNSANAGISIDTFAGAGGLISRRANTSGASPSALASGDTIFSFAASGWGATTYASGTRAKLNFRTTEAWTDSAQGTDILIQTTPVGSTTIASVAQLKNSGCVFNGTNTNDSAAASKIGQIVSSQVLVASEVTLTTATTADVTSISLTAGDWDVEGNVVFDETNTTLSTQHIASISTTSATLPTAPGTGAFAKISHAGVATTDASLYALPTGRTRQSLSSTTTVYLVAQATFPASTCKAYGYIYARRAR